jgi:Ni,Fe-hydrogenase III large subunit
VDAARIDDLLARLEATTRDTTGAAQLLWDSPSVMGRFEETGAIDPKTCRRLGLVGPVARACGEPRDVRYEFPTGFYTLSHIPISQAATGDVLARAQVRWLEIQRSATFARETLRALPGGPIRAEAVSAALAPGRAVVSMVEGWRGEICHVALTDETGRLAAYKVVDPSFHNWMGLAMALRDQAISDFPLCNKSFDLSYCGHDL